MRTRRSKSPLPPVLSVQHQDGFVPDSSIDGHIGEQVGGGSRRPSPPQETPTRLRTRVKPSQKARDNVVAQQAELRRARMGGDDMVPIPSLSLEVPVVNDPEPINEAREQSSQHTVPVTHIIPPTPATATSTDVGINDPSASASGGCAAVDADHNPFSINTNVEPSTPTSARRAAAINANPDGGASSTIANADDPSTPTSGRRTAAVNSALAAGYDKLEAILSNLVEETSLTTQQVLEGWHKSRGRSVNGTNHWNLYTRYAMKHEEQERGRLSIPVETPLTPSVRRRLYTKFKEDNADTWQEILELHDMIESGQSSPQTIAQRAQTFTKLKRRVISVLESESARHGFEAAIVMCGSVVNEDASLGFTYTTPGATTFFETRCRANSDMIIGHLKAHVYNHVSLEAVSEVFDKDAGPQGENTNLLPAVALRAPSEMIEDPDKLAADGDGVMTYIKDRLMHLIQSAGGEVSKFKRSTFPWATLLNHLTIQALVMRGWPDGVLMPGQLRHPGARTKGIADLTFADRRRLHQALTAGEITVVKLIGREERRALSEFNAPVIVGAAPPADSQRAKALQMYGNGTIDYNGPDRLPPSSSAATRIKQKPARAPKHTPDDPIVIGSGSEDGARIIPAKRAKASADDPIIISSGSDNATCAVATKKSKSDAPLNTKPATKTSFFALDSSDDEVSIAANEDEHAATTARNRGDYHEPNGQSRKRKAKKPLLPSNILKKPSLAPERTKSRKGKEVEWYGKGKKKSKCKSVEWIDVSDSEEETLTVKAEPASSNVQLHADAATDNVFSGGETTSTLENFVPSTPRGPNNRSEQAVEPPSPSPKRNMSLQPLTEAGPSHQPLAEHAAIPQVGVPPLISQTAMNPPTFTGPHAPHTGPGNAALPQTMFPTFVGPQPPLLHAGPGILLSQMAPPPLLQAIPQPAAGPSPPLLNAGPSREERLRFGEWSDQARQIGGGYPPHAFHTPQAMFLPCHGNEAAIPPSMMDMRRAPVYLDIPGSHHDDRDMYRGDPRGAYGGFYLRPEGTAIYLDREGSRQRSLVVFPDAQQTNSRQASAAPSDAQQTNQTNPMPY